MATSWPRSIKASRADVEIIIADADDVTALEALAARTKVVLSTAGLFIATGRIWLRLAFPKRLIMSILPARIFGSKG